MHTDSRLERDRHLALYRVSTVKANPSLAEPGLPLEAYRRRHCFHYISNSRCSSPVRKVVRTPPRHLSAVPELLERPTLLLSPRPVFDRLNCLQGLAQRWQAQNVTERASLRPKQTRVQNHALRLHNLLHLHLYQLLATEPQHF
jgi:hypothetical protein